MISVTLCTQPVIKCMCDYIQHNRLKSNLGPFKITTGNQFTPRGLHTSAENEPIPISAHTPIATRLEIINRAISPETSARTPTLEVPS